MKNILTLIVALLLGTTLWAQSPEKMSYQAVIRNADNNLVTNTQVGMQISILQTSADGFVIYTETQMPTTNANGLVSVEIGTGETTDDFTAIEWSTGTYFLETETDPTGGTAYTITGTSQLMSVPYALHAKTAANGITTVQASEITANTAKVGVTTAQTTILENTSGTNTGDQDISGITTNTTAIALNTAKTGISTTQATAITNNTAKVGLTTVQATILASTSGTNTGNQTISRTGTTVTLSNEGGTFIDSVNTYTPGSGIDISNNVISTIGTSGKVINVTYQVNNTRGVISPANSIILESFSVNKQSSTSILVIQGSISGWGNASGDLQQGWNYGTGMEVLGQSVMYNSNQYSKIFPTHVIIAGHTTTGVQTLVFRYFSNNGSTSERPFLVYNPNSTDQPRMGQTSSVYTVFEIEP